jgi:hypothetical protein
LKIEFLIYDVKDDQKALKKLVLGEIPSEDVGEDQQSNYGGLLA